MSAPTDTEGAGTAAKQRRMKDIVASTLLVGGGSVVNILCSVVRSKVISLVAGPAGIGLQGLLQSTMRTMISVASMSLQTTGVREVARLRTGDDAAELGHTLRALRLATLVLAAVAGAALVAFHQPISHVILDDAAPAWTVAVVGLGVFAQVMYAAYDSFLRGYRRVALLTKASVLANILAATVASVLVLKLGDDGVAWAIVAQPVCLLLTAAYAGRDFSRHLGPRDRDRTRGALGRILGTGVVLALTALLGPGVQLVARVLIARWASLDEVGYFQAASSVSLLYLGFVLGAMSLDYYPRLAEATGDRPALTRMVNEQARVSLLLAGPAVVGMIALSEQVVAVLYTREFGVTADILRWQLLGDVLKIGSWTLGYLILAQGRPRLYFLVELTWNASYLAVLVVLLPSMGLQATPIAYIAASAVYFGVVCLVAHRLVGFTWTRGNSAFMCATAGVALLNLGSHELLPRPWGWVAGVGMTTAFGLVCVRQLVRDVGLRRLLRRGRKPRA